jgi:hypothetical protein
LYKDVFLLQTEDLNKIVKSEPKELTEYLERECRECNRELTSHLELKGVKDAEVTAGLCLDCFMNTTREGNWWAEFWA